MDFRCRKHNIKIYWSELAILQPKRNFGVIILDLHNAILALYVYFPNQGATFYG